MPVEIATEPRKVRFGLTLLLSMLLLVGPGGIAQAQQETFDTLAYVENGDLYVGSADAWEDRVLIDSNDLFRLPTFANDGLDLIYNRWDGPNSEILIASASGSGSPRLLATGAGRFGIDAGEVVYSTLRGFESSFGDRLMSVAIDQSHLPAPIGPAPDDEYGFAFIGNSPEFGEVFQKVPAAPPEAPPPGPTFLSLLQKSDGFVVDLKEGVDGRIVSHDGRDVVYTERTGDFWTIKVLSLATGETIDYSGANIVRYSFLDFEFSPDGSTLAVGVTLEEAVGAEPIVILFDRTGSPVDELTLPTSGFIGDMGFSPDGRHLTVGGGPAAGISDVGWVRTFEIDYTSGSGRATGFTTTETGVVTALAYSPRPLPNFPARDVQPGLVDPATATWRVWDADGNGFDFYFGIPGDLPLVGDWDCDGFDSPGMFRQSTGLVYLRNSATTGIADVTFTLGDPGDIPLAGDFNGDGCDTVSVYRPAQGRAFIANRLGPDGGALSADYDFYFGEPGDKPFVGDFNGDGAATVGLHRESTGFVYYTNTEEPVGAVAPTVDQFFYGIPGDRFITGDWNGTGADSVAAFRPSEAVMYLTYENRQAAADETHRIGFPGWLPVAGSFRPL